MNSSFRRGSLICVALFLGLLALLPAAANAPFNTREVATGVRNPNGVPAVMKVDSAGRPVFAVFSGYEFQTDFGNVDVVRCDDTTCSSSTRHAVAGPVPANASLGLALDAAGNPVVAYSYDVPGSVSVKVVRCADPACEVASSPHSIASGTAPHLQVLDLEMSEDDRPAIALEHPGEYALFWRCGVPACTISSGGTLSSQQTEGSDYSLAYGTDGLPVVSFQSNGLVAAFCDVQGCTAFDVTVRPIDTSNAGVGHHSTVEIHPLTGYPVFAYSDEVGNLKIALCNDAQCVDPRSIQTLGTDGTQVRGISLVFEDNNPVVVARTSDAGNERIRWIRCGNMACTQHETYIVDGPHAGLGSTPPTMTYRNDFDQGFRIGFYQRDTETVTLLYASTEVGNGVDVDCNGYYDAMDVLIIMRSLAGLDGNSTATEPCDLDVNDDNEVDMLDVLWMRRLAAGFFN